MNKQYAVFLVLVFWVQATVAARGNEADWTQYIIPAEQRGFDFKTVAKGAVPEKQFVLKNPFLEAIHIGKITASCVCTTLRFEKEKLVLETYDELVLTVQFRGDLYDGQRTSTITIIIDQPSKAEIQLNIRGDIRTDLTIQAEQSPSGATARQNAVDFGNVAIGQQHTRDLTITYTGTNPLWRVVDVLSEDDFIRTDIIVAPPRGRARVFRVRVSLDESAPPGHIHTHLLLITNDDSQRAGFRQEIPIAVRATVGSVIRISPPSLFLGVLKPGEASARRNVMLSGTQPFRITKIESCNPAIETFFQNDENATPKLRHTVPIAYKNPVEGDGAPENGDNGGVMRATIQITTDIPGIAPIFYVTASIRQQEEE